MNKRRHDKEYCCSKCGAHCIVTREAQDIVKQLLAPINELREELLAAWIAKYGFDPKDAIIEQRVGTDALGTNLNVRVWIERDNGARCEVHGKRIEELEAENAKLKAELEATRNGDEHLRLTQRNADLEAELARTREEPICPECSNYPTPERMCPQWVCERCGHRESCDE